MLESSEAPRRSAGAEAPRSRAAAAPAPRAAPAPAPAPRHARPVPREPRDERSAKPHASPSVRRFARELGVDSRGAGQRPKGRILQRTCRRSSRARCRKAPPQRREGGGGAPFNLPPWPQVDFAKFGPVETKPLSRIKKLSGPYLHRNWVTIPHVTQHDEADITELEAFRKAQTDETEKKGIKLTMLAFLMKACVVALKQVPAVQLLARVGESLVLKKYFHIGVAVDTPNGLVVPVIRDVDSKGVFELAQRAGRSQQAGARRQARARRHAGRHASRSRASAASAAPRSRRSSTRPKSRSSAVGSGDAAGVERQGVRAAADAAAVALLRSPRDRRRQGARFTAYLAAVLSDIRKIVL